MNLKLYNTKSRSIENFTPLSYPEVSMYACGPTVYDKTHIGHIRKYIGDDILRRTLMLLGYKVNHVMNITDVGHLTNDSDTGNDKFENKALVEGKSVWEIAKYYTDYFHESMFSVNILNPNFEVKATEHIDSMLILINKLMKKGYAYETNNAVYFDTEKDLNYGKFSGQKLSEKEIGSRDGIVIDTNKKNPRDFVLWFKRVGKFENHTMYWPSPWGEGFPGWHIECSAMSMQYLGETIDIHTGGIDHIPVHHENEIAQSQCATGHQFVRYWIHYDFLNVDGEKMSKSKNNFYTIEDIRSKNIDPLAMRILTMSTSYRKPLNFTWESLETSNNLLKKIQKFASHQNIIGEINLQYKKYFLESLTDDLNTSKVLAVLWEIFNDENIKKEDKWATILYFDQVLGLNLEKIPKFLITDQAKKLIEKRDLARENKDFESSDLLRKELNDLGYNVLDSSDGTILN